jgi:hypothetical protein
VKRRSITFTRIVRGREPVTDPDDASSTPGERMAAVWDVTRSALAWDHAAEPDFKDLFVELYLFTGLIRA